MEKTFDNLTHGQREAARNELQSNLFFQYIKKTCLEKAQYDVLQTPDESARTESFWILKGVELLLGGLQSEIPEEEDEIEELKSSPEDFEPYEKDNLDEEIISELGDLEINL